SKVCGLPLRLDRVGLPLHQSGGICRILCVEGTLGQAERRVKRNKRRDVYRHSAFMIMFLLVTLYVVGLTFYAFNKIVFKGQWEYIIIFMCLYLPFYTTILSIVYQATGSPVVVAVFQYLKELFLLLGLVSFILYKKDLFGYGFKLNVVDKLFITFLSLAVIYAFLPLGEASFINKVLYLKNTLLMGAFYFFGRNTHWGDVQIAQLFKCVMIIAILAVCLNAVE